MAWTIYHGQLGAGFIMDTRRTEDDAVAYACELVRKGRGVHSVWDRGSEEPKYRHEDIVALANRPVES